MITNRNLIILCLSWFGWKLIEHYLVPYFFVPFLWIGESFIALLAVVISLIFIIVRRKNITRRMLANTATIIVLAFLTVDRWVFDGWIEKADWYILRQKRTEIVRDVLRGKLKPNVSWNEVICQLPFQLPIISHGGNEIIIDKQGKVTTIYFYIFRGMFNAPSSKFIYTNNPNDIQNLESEIKYNPDSNYKIENNWYRIEN